MKYPFTYTAVLYDELDFDYKPIYKKESGLGLANSFAHAMEQIENYYSEDLVKIINLELFEECSLLIVPEAFAKDFSTNDFTSAAIPCDHNGEPVAEPSSEALAEQPELDLEKIINYCEGKVTAISEEITVEG